jgi:hypothetical protein
MSHRNESAAATRVPPVLAIAYLARYESPFRAYMALQCALLRLYIRRGGSAEDWCRRMAPLFRRRYAAAFGAHALHTATGEPIRSCPVEASQPQHARR